MHVVDARRAEMQGNSHAACSSSATLLCSLPWTTSQNAPCQQSGHRGQSRKRGFFYKSRIFCEISSSHDKACPNFSRQSLLWTGQQRFPPLFSLLSGVVFSGVGTTISWILASASATVALYKWQEGRKSGEISEQLKQEDLSVNQAIRSNLDKV